MKKCIKIKYLPVVSLLLLSLSVGCNPRECKSQDSETDTTESFEVNNSGAVTGVNFFIEASGSMKGYFSNNQKSELESLIRDYYDRAEESGYEGDCNFYYIYNQNVDKATDIETFLDDAQKSCMSTDSKIENMLTESMSYNGVNLFISDFGYVVSKGTPASAQSQIRKMFSNKLKSNPDFSVVIRKYFVGFNGTYYPGAIACNQTLPIYLWIFGDGSNVKQFFELEVKRDSESEVVFQANQQVDFSMKTANSRAIKGGKSIVVKNWDNDRKDKKHHVTITADLSNVILSKDEILDRDMYELVAKGSSANWEISNIEPSNDGQYVFDLIANKPSPCDVTLGYKLSLPDWVEQSNFEGSGIPPAGKTLNIAPQISGVYDAYKSSKYIFSINFNIQ